MNNVLFTGLESKIPKVTVETSVCGLSALKDGEIWIHILFPSCIYFSTFLSSWCNPKCFPAASRCRFYAPTKRGINTHSCKCCWMSWQDKKAPMSAPCWYSPPETSVLSHYHPQCITRISQRSVHAFSICKTEFHTKWLPFLRLDRLKPKFLQPGYQTALTLSLWCLWWTKGSADLLM